MARLPYFPMFPTDFEAKTSHLTLAEDGAYNRLLRLMWMTPGCSLPDDDEWIKRRMRCSEQEFQAVVRVVIDEFCERSNGRVSNAKLSEIFEASNASHERRVLAGSKGGKTKALKTMEIDPSNAKAMPKQPEPEPEPDIEDKSSIPRKRGTRLDEDWILPDEWLAWAVSDGWPETTAKAEALKFKDYWIAKSGRDASKQNWQATWRNWMRNSKTPKAAKMAGTQAAKPTADNPTVKAIKEGKRHLLQSTSATFARQAIELGLVTVEECRRVGVI